MADEPTHDDGTGGLRFFGMATAGLSHELRNVLATAQQAGGLLEDYLAAGRSGRSVDPERFATVVARVGRAANRGLEYADQLHWLGHSVDRTQQPADLVEVARRVVELRQYAARQRRFTLELVVHAVPSAVVGSTLELALLVDCCIELMSPAAGEGAAIVVTVDEDADNVLLWVQTDGATGSPTAGALADDTLTALAGTIGASVMSIEPGPPGARLTLRFQRIQPENEPRSSDGP